MHWAGGRKALMNGEIGRLGLEFTALPKERQGKENVSPKHSLLLYAASEQLHET